MQVVMDRRSEFSGMITRDYGVKKKIITICKPQANAIVEKAHQTIGNVPYALGLTLGTLDGAKLGMSLGIADDTALGMSLGIADGATFGGVTLGEVLGLCFSL